MFKHFDKNPPINKLIFLSATKPVCYCYVLLLIYDLHYAFLLNIPITNFIHIMRVLFSSKLQDLQAQEDIDIHHPKDTLDTQEDPQADLQVDLLIQDR